MAKSEMVLFIFTSLFLTFDEQAICIYYYGKTNHDQKIVHHVFTFFLINKQFVFIAMTKQIMTKKRLAKRSRPTEY